MSSFAGGFLGGLGGGAIGRAAVELVLDATAYQAQLGAAQADTAAATGEMEATTTKSSAGMVTAYAAAGLAAFELGKISIQAAIEQQQATDKLTNSIENSTKVTLASKQGFLDQANAIREQTGVSDEAITSAQALLVQQGLQADQITQLTPLIVDLAAKQGIDLVTAAKAVGKAVNGSSGSLARLGVTIDKTAFAADHYTAIFNALGAAQGYAAQKAAAEPWIKLQSQLHELAEIAGKELLPAIVADTDALAQLSEGKLPAATSAADAMSKAALFLAPGIAGVTRVSGDAAQKAQEFGDAVNEVGRDLQSGAIDTTTATQRIQALADQYGYTQFQVAATVQSFEASTAAQNADATAATKLAAAHQKAAAAAKEQKQAEQELAGGMVGLLASLEQLRTDQAAVNKLKAQGKQGTQDYANAVQAELQDQLAYSSAIQDLAKQMKAAGATTQDVKNKVFDLGRAAGLSRSDIKALWDSVSSGAKNAHDNITGVGDAIDSLRSRARGPIDIRFRLTAENLTGLPSSDLVKAIIQADLLRNAGG